jgi:alkylation response protein AidB-like acyl-CoA dehydrogenase
VSEQIGRVTNALGWVVHTPPAWAPSVVSQEQLDRWIKPTVRESAPSANAITEEGAGSDVDAISATAKRDGDEYVLNGTKMHVTSFNHADYAFFQGKLVGGDHEGEHAMFFVDIPSDGLRVVRVPAYSAHLRRPAPARGVQRRPRSRGNLVGEEGGGMAYTYEWFRYERLMIAARCCGAAERLIEEATRSRSPAVQFGEPIIDFQSIAFMLADSVTELHAARLMTYRLAQEIDEGVDVKIQHAHCSMAKLYASEMANRVADRAVQVFGGRGYMRRTSPSASTASFGSTASGKGPRRSSARSSRTSSRREACRR